ncbi:penicillin-binding protein [Halostreptopolyspora alba]|uniref:Penicillin-binding protein n=1 Tax=Halostreptopolyspora alba TaxID=2487137 RepID=A0A3N0EAK1_9ACTN|nr:penicillin-binding protein [Nocardiopsaceae bacterium YIM 96095]
MAEQGYNFNEDGTWGEDATNGAGAPGPETEQGAVHEADTASGTESETSPGSAVEAGAATGSESEWAAGQLAVTADDPRESPEAPETPEEVPETPGGEDPGTTGNTPVGDPSGTAEAAQPSPGESSPQVDEPTVGDDTAVEDKPAGGDAEPDPRVPAGFGAEPEGGAGLVTGDLTAQFPTVPPDEAPADATTHEPSAPGLEPATSAVSPSPSDEDSPATHEVRPEPDSPFEPRTADDADPTPPTTGTSVDTTSTVGASVDGPETPGATPPPAPPAPGATAPHQSPGGGAAPSGGEPGGPGAPAGPGGRPAAVTAEAGAAIAERGGPGKPGKGAKPAKSAKPLWWRVTRAGLITAGVLFVLGIAGFGVAYAVIPVPDAAKAAATDQGTTFYYSDGETEFGERGVNREPVDVETVPQHVQDSVTSAEDRGFWTEPGVSVSGTLRAAWSTLTGQQLQGGSTITQQMVRNYYEGVSKEQTISRKFKEIIISLKVDRSKSKEWVMEQYLNTIYFGRNAYGIQAAAEAYYHKDVEELDPEEAAFLAAAIQQPTKFGEADSTTTDAMEHRWEAVVEGMVETEAISASDAEAMEFPDPEEKQPQTDLSGYKGYMLQQAMSELEDLGYTEDNINRGGYRVVTTFDKDLMEAAKNAVESTIDPDALPEGVRAGLTAIEPGTGEVVAFYGGKDYNENQYDSAFRGSAQAGSAMKPYVLATALKNGYSLHSQVDGRGPQSIHGTSIQNAGNDPGGPMNLIEATRRSNNTGYVNLAMEVGLEEVVDTAYEIGLPEGSIGDDQVVPTLALGINDVRPVDQASGFATFANGGEHIEPHVIREIQNPEGENLREEVASNEALTEGQAADVTHALQQVVRSGTGTQARLPDGRPVAGKTGTTDGSVATWFSGYTPQLSTATGVYNSNNEAFRVPGWGELSGGTLSATIWREFMTTAMEGEDVERFPEPNYGGTTQDWAPDVPSGEPEEPEREDPREPEQPDPGRPDPGEPDPGEPDPGDPNPGGPDPEPEPGDPENPGGTPDDPESGDDTGTGDESRSEELE